METTMILKGIAFAALGIGLFVLAVYVVMRLWNWLVPSLFKGPKLRFVQALGLFVLARLLFGFGGLGRGGHYGYHGQWREGRWHEQHRVAPKPEKRGSNQSTTTTYKPLRETAETN